MLLELRVENLLLIERAELRLGAGLNVITGETGAGKTVLAHALDLLLGGKPRPGVVRPGAEEAYVEGVFALPPGLLDGLDELRERLPEGEEEIVLGRRVGAEGRTRAFVQGRAAAAADLRAVGEALGVTAPRAEAERLEDDVTGADPELDGLAERLRGLRIEAEDLGAELRRYEEGLQAEPGRLEEVEARLDLYERLKRKHGGRVEAVIAHAERCRAERARLEGMEVALEGLEAELADAVSE